MMVFLLKLTICWGFFALLYALLLRSETFFRSNRLYLLGTMLTGIVLAAVGDQLLALDELVLRDANSVAEAKAKIAPGQSMRLILLRESRQMEVLIVPQAPNAFPNKATQTPVPPNALYL